MCVCVCVVLQIYIVFTRGAPNKAVKKKFVLFIIGIISVLANVRQFNDLAHPLCRNLRDGDWLMDYVVTRLMPFIGTRQVSHLKF